MKIKSGIVLVFSLSFILTVVILFLFYFAGILRTSEESGILFIIISLSVGFLISMLFTVYLRTVFSSGFQKLLYVLKNFFIDKYISEKIDSGAERKDEFGQLFEGFSELYKKYDAYTEFAKQLSEGNYKVVPEFGKNEVLGAALLDIKESLRISDKEKRYSFKEVEKNNWYQSGVTAFTLLLQQDFKSTKEMAYPAVKKIAEHVGVEQAGIFTLKEKDGKKYLLLEAAYAYDKKKQLDTEVEIGESLAGKCAKEQKMIKIDDLPEGYTYISSGLGEDTPETLILLPLMYEKKLFGVLEIASLKRVPDYRINFLKIIGERIAAEISNINTKYLTAKLTEAYKKQSEELALKEKRYKDTINKLANEKEQLLQMNSSFLVQINQFNKYVPTVFVNSDKIITRINDAAAKLYRIKRNDVLNKPYFDIFPSDESYLKLFEKVFEGEEMRKKRKLKDADIIEKFTPVADKDGKINRLMITALKLS
ncbi:MAG: GAF domain-containing protein [Chlorobi bacterium]|nr:GAF domain-containing protein [Chlorobiota bacterium]